MQLTNQKAIQPITLTIWPIKLITIQLTNQPTNQSKTYKQPTNQPTNQSNKQATTNNPTNQTTVLCYGLHIQNKHVPIRCMSENIWRKHILLVRVVRKNHRIKLTGVGNDHVWMFLKDSFIIIIHKITSFCCMVA